MTSATEREKRLAAVTAAEEVRDGMAVGLGTGSTVAYLLPALADRKLDIHCVATSPETARMGRELGLTVHGATDAAAPTRLDIAIDGADQVSRDGWLVKGGGAAHTREKAVAAAAARFVVIVSSDKLVERIGPPIPLELLDFYLPATIERIGHVRLRDVPLSPDGGVIADYDGAVDDPAELARRFSAAPGIIEHGLFPPAMVAEIICAQGERIERIVPAT